jgi:hypothetical protein
MLIDSVEVVFCLNILRLSKRLLASIFLREDDLEDLELFKVVVSVLVCLYGFLCSLDTAQ